MAISKTLKSEKTPSHPKYNEMIASAIRALKERSGSSRQAILKYVVAFYRIEDERRAGVHVKLALKRGVSDGSLRQMKGSGASGSFRLAKDTKTVAKSLSVEKEPKLKNAKKPTIKKPSKNPSSKQTVTKKSTSKQTTTKKPGVKKSSAKKPSTKQTAAKKPVPKKTAEKKSDVKKAMKTPRKKTTGSKTVKAPIAKKFTKKNVKPSSKNTKK